MAYNISHNPDPVYFFTLISGHLFIHTLYSNPEVTNWWLFGQILPTVLISLTAELPHSFFCLQILFLAIENFIQFFKCACSPLSLKCSMWYSLCLEYSFLLFVTWLIPTLPFDSVIRQILPLIWSLFWPSKLRLTVPHVLS